MATSLDTLIARTRRWLQDWPELDVLTASITSVATTITVADGTLYPKNFALEIDKEVLVVSTAGSGTTAAVRRAQRGSTATTHANSATVLIKPSYFSVSIIDALNQAKDDCYPYIYKPVMDTTLTTLASTYEYTVPNMSGTYGGDTIPIPAISRIELKYSGETDYREIRSWSIRRTATPKIQFRREQTAGATIRVHGFAPFPDLASGDSLDAQWPKNAEKLLPVGAASFLLATGEAGRARVDTLASDDREQANKPGASLSISNALYQRFLRMLSQESMGPLPKHQKTTF